MAVIYGLMPLRELEACSDNSALSLTLRSSAPTPEYCQDKLLHRLEGAVHIGTQADRWSCWLGCLGNLAACQALFQVCMDTCSLVSKPTQAYLGGMH